jgi:hypothetical protein
MELNWLVTRGFTLHLRKLSVETFEFHREDRSKALTTITDRLPFTQSLVTEMHNVRRSRGPARYPNMH